MLSNNDTNNNNININYTNFASPPKVNLNNSFLLFTTNNNNISKIKSEEINIQINHLLYH